MRRLRPHLPLALIFLLPVLMPAPAPLPPPSLPASSHMVDPPPPSRLLVLLDDSAANCSALIGGVWHAAEGGLLPLPAQGQVEIEVEGNRYALHPGLPVVRFYRLDLRLLSASGSPLDGDELEVAVNGTPIKPWGGPVPEGQHALQVRIRSEDVCSLTLNMTSKMALVLKVPASPLCICIRDHSGKPLPGERITLIRAPPAAPASSGHSYDLLTDPSGRAVLKDAPHGVYSVSCGGSNYLIIHNSSPQVITVSPPHRIGVTVKDAQLLLPTRVVCLVLDAGGSPVPGEAVLLRTGSWSASAVTGRAGEVCFCLPPSILPSEEIVLSTSRTEERFTASRGAAAPVILISSLSVVVAAASKKLARRQGLA